MKKNPTKQDHAEQIITNAYYIIKSEERDDEEFYSALTKYILQEVLQNDTQHYGYEEIKGIVKGLQGFISRERYTKSYAKTYHSRYHQFDVPKKSATWD